MKPKKLTLEEQAAFDQWASECDKEEILDPDGEVVAVAYSHPSQRIQLSVSDFPEGVKPQIPE